MTSPLTVHPAPALLSAFLTTITDSIHPLSARAVAAGSKLFGAAVLRKRDLSVVIADTNQEAAGPLWHGETWTLRKFWELPPGDGAGQRPDVKDCLFLTTHEPCSLCLSAITWSGFDNFTYMYTYEETHHIFECHGDLDILNAVFHVPTLTTGPPAQAASLDGKQPQIRPQYKLRNEFFVALSFSELLAAIEDVRERERWEGKVEAVKRSYGRLAEAYRRNIGVE